MPCSQFKAFFNRNFYIQISFSARKQSNKVSSEFFSLCYCVIFVAQVCRQFLAFILFFAFRLHSVIAYFQEFNVADSKPYILTYFKLIAFKLFLISPSTSNQYVFIPKES